MSLDLTESSGLVDLKRGVLWGLWKLISASGIAVTIVNTAASMGLALEAGGNLAAIFASIEKVRLACYPIPGVSAFMAVSGTSASVALAAGTYRLLPTIDVCYIVQNLVGNVPAVWLTAPAKFLPAAGERIVAVAAGQVLTAITNGGTGSIEYVPLT